MDLGPGGLSSPGPSGFGGGYNATGTGYDASGGSNEPVMFPEQLNLPGPEAPKFAQTIQRAVDSPFGRGAEFAFKTALSKAFPAYGLITLAQDIYNAGGISPYFQQQKENFDEKPEAEMCWVPATVRYVVFFQRREIYCDVRQYHTVWLEDRDPPRISHRTRRTSQDHERRFGTSETRHHPAKTRRAV